jgi:hypothetical protein
LAENEIRSLKKNKKSAREHPPRVIINTIDYIKALKACLQQAGAKEVYKMAQSLLN